MRILCPCIRTKELDCVAMLCGGVATEYNPTVCCSPGCPDKSVVNGFGAFMRLDRGATSLIVRDIAPGLPVRIAFAASPARQLALAGLDAVGVAARVRALHETEAIAG